MAAPSSAEVAIEPALRGAVAGEPATFAPPESVAALGSASNAIDESGPKSGDQNIPFADSTDPRRGRYGEPQGDYEQIPSSSPYDGPLDTDQRPNRRTRAQGRLARALRQPPAGRRVRDRESMDRVQERDVMFEFDRLAGEPTAERLSGGDRREPARRRSRQTKPSLTHPEIEPARYQDSEIEESPPEENQYEELPMEPPVGEEILDGEPSYEMLPDVSDAPHYADGSEMDGYVVYEPNCGVYEPDCAVYESSCGVPTGACDCGDPACAGCGDDCEMCEVVTLSVPKPLEFTLFGGVHGFKGPLDGPVGNNRDRGNFGIHEGFNWGGCYPWGGHGRVGYQIGYHLTHSQLHGSTTTPTSTPTDDGHTQQFVTAGLFRRPGCAGWQYGAVWDMLRDERFGSVDFHQIRAEIGLIGNTGREIGFATAVHINDTSFTSTPYRTVDQYLLYYRIHAPLGGEARFYGGLNDGDKGILGANFLLPMHDHWSLASGFTYLIPDDAGSVGAREEAWNLSMGLVWHLGCRARSCHQSIYRPLFDVADNGSLIVDDRP